MLNRTNLLACVIPALFAVPASASTWIERSNGDLSNDGLAPSILTLTAGNNVVQGSFGSPDLDYLTVIVATGFVLDAIVTGVGNNTGLSRSFIGVQAGSVMTVPPDATSAAGLLGWTHYGTADGVNLLPAIGTGFGATGFIGPLSAGAYTFWFNEVSSDANLTFDMNFHTTPAPVPLPAALSLLLSGLAGLGTLAGKRKVASPA